VRKRLTNVLIWLILQLNGWKMERMDGRRAWQKKCKGGLLTLRGGWKYALQQLDVK
jgi:nitrogen fixation protein